MLLLHLTHSFFVFHMTKYLMCLFDFVCTKSSKANSIVLSATPCHADYDGSYFKAYRNSRYLLS